MLDCEVTHLPVVVLDEHVPALHTSVTPTRDPPTPATPVASEPSMSVIPPVDVKEGTAILEKLFNEFPQLPSPECPIGQDSNTRFTDRKELSPRTFLHIAWPIAVDRPSVSKEKSFWSSTTKHIAISLHSLLQDVRKGHAVFVTLDLQSGYSG